MCQGRRKQRCKQACCHAAAVSLSYTSHLVCTMSLFKVTASASPNRSGSCYIETSTHSGFTETRGPTPHHGRLSHSQHTHATGILPPLQGRPPTSACSQAPQTPQSHVDTSVFTHQQLQLLSALKDDPHHRHHLQASSSMFHPQTSKATHQQVRSSVSEQAAHSTAPQHHQHRQHTTKTVSWVRPAGIPDAAHHTMTPLPLCSFTGPSHSACD